MSRLIVFTDLDGTLLVPGTYDCSPALAVLSRLQARGDRVVAVTSRTRLEVERLVATLGIDAAGIVENGSAIHWSERGRATHIVLGCTTDEATKAFERLRHELDGGLHHLGELGLADVARITGLNGADAELAIRREHSIVVIPSLNIPFARAAVTVERLGLRLILGDAFWHVVGKGVDKGRAVQVLHQYLADETYRSVGLGNGPSDASLLESVDLPIVVPGENGPHPALASRGWLVAPSPGPSGWAAAMTAVLSSADA